MAKDGRGGTICVRESEGNQIRLPIPIGVPVPREFKEARPGSINMLLAATPSDAATSESIESMTVLDDITGYMKNLAVDMFPVPPESVHAP